MMRLAWLLGAVAELAILAAVLEALGASVPLAVSVAFLLAASSVAIVAVARRNEASAAHPAGASIERAANLAFVLVGLLLIWTGERPLVRGSGVAAVVAGVAGAAAHLLLARRRLRRDPPGPKL